MGFTRGGKTRTPKPMELEGSQLQCTGRSTKKKEEEQKKTKKKGKEEKQKQTRNVVHTKDFLERKKKRKSKAKRGGERKSRRERGGQASCYSTDTVCVCLVSFRSATSHGMARQTQQDGTLVI